MRGRRALGFVGSFALAIGCSRYSAKPLSRDAVDERLALPNDQALQVRVSELRHPILRPMAIDLTDGISPDEAAVLAVLVNPGLRAERAQHQIEAAQLLQAGLLPNPQLTAGLELPYQSSPPDNFTAYNLGLDWEITALIAHDQKKRAASAALASVNLEIAWKEWQVSQEAKAAAFDVIALEGQLEAAREADQQLGENLKAVQNAVNQHHKTLLELSAARTSAQDAHAVTIAQQKALSLQTLAFKRALGFPPDRAAVVRAPDPLPARLDPPREGELLRGLEERRLDLVALRRGYESQDATLRAAILAQFPKINIGFSNARDTSNVHTFGIGATIDIPLFDRNQGVIAASTATRQKLFDEYATRVFTARSDIAIAIADIAAINDQIAAAQDAIPGFEQLVRTYEQALQQGHVDVLSAYAARSTLWQRRIDAIKLKQQLVTSWIALEIASGQYLRMEAGPTTGPTTQEFKR